MDVLRTFAREWNGEIGLADLLLGVIGFAITLVMVYRSKRAAELAEDAAKKARQSLLHISTVADLSAAMSTMEEIKRLHRYEVWTLLPERYSVLRRTLVSIKGLTPGLAEADQKILQSAIQHFASIEESVERALRSKKPTNAVRWNKIVSEQIDQLGEVLTTLRRNIGA